MGHELEIQTSLIFINEKSNFILSETRNSNLFNILSLITEKQIYLVMEITRKTRKANLFGQKLQIQTSFIF